jgi:hypothetical protein
MALLIILNKKLKNVFLGLLCHTSLKNEGRLESALIRSLKPAFFAIGGIFSLMVQSYALEASIGISINKKLIRCEHLSANTVKLK